MPKKGRKPQGDGSGDGQRNETRFENKNRGLYQTPSRTATKLAELESLRTEVQDKLLYRLQLVSEVLEDNDWLSTTYQGDRNLAREELMRRYFFTLRGYISTHKLLDMYHTIDANQWNECDYDVSAVEAIYDGFDQKSENKARRTNWRKQYEELREKHEELEKELAKWKQIAEERHAKIEAQQTEIQELGDRLARLEGRLEEIRSRSDNKPLSQA